MHKKATEILLKTSIKKMFTFCPKCDKIKHLVFKKINNGGKFL
jgi:hypothetical protein